MNTKTLLTSQTFLFTQKICERVYSIDKKYNSLFEYVSQTLNNAFMNYWILYKNSRHLNIRQQFLENMLFKSLE